MNIMTSNLRLLLGLFLTIAISSNAWAGIINSKHNLSSAGPGTSYSGTTEVCVFCHTPHGSDENATVPLWNRALPDSTAFQTYNQGISESLDGQVVGIGSVSLACLSCHDGVSAMDAMINTPGSGIDALTGNWTGNSANGTLSSAGITNIGTDLRNDHPIGVQYGGGGCDNTNTNTGASCNTTIDPDFVQAERATVGWFVDITDPGIRNKTDMILYTRNFSNGPGPSVECASCHDPHSDTNTTFLRTNNDGSAVCLACHVK